MQKPHITNNPITIPIGTYNGKKIFGSPPAGVVPIGVDKDTSLWCFVVQREKLRLVGSLANHSTVSTSSLQYTNEQGSTIGFAEQFGVSVTATAGIDVKIFSASVSATVSASLTFSQAFSKMTSHQVTAPAQPNKITCVYEGAMDITYYCLRSMPKLAIDKNDNPVFENGKVKLEPMLYLWCEVKTDSIETGGFAVKEFDLGTIPPAP
ncbi:hypothetical protein [Donghicola mangrovi]|uniref:Uncharacterized protein n=1 Tax=Donghicola mangrovi TaxID=2729614 RepID=A0A850Q968_9RHOB|nr:hypothetical protein [Donghicola mangrovi]NVO25696.1 hypothetical protein [Donghicola mangrovi]